MPEPVTTGRALTGLGVPHDVKTYPGVGHSFLNKDAGPRWVQRFVAPRLGVDHVRGAGTMPGGDARP